MSGRALSEFPAEYYNVTICDTFYASYADSCDRLDTRGYPMKCCPGEGGMFLPVGGPCSSEMSGSYAVRATFYFFFLIWTFLGVAIIADLFMGAIEMITQATYVKRGADGKRHVYRVWNPTVANLSLMALGSSAPEILLNVLEILSNGFYAGALGPSTIVGSAAFNLLCIAAVCVVAINDGIRYVKETKVYALTASCSVFAYVWLLIILGVMSPDLVTVTEAVLTLVFFVILLLFAFVLDKNCFRPKEEDEEGTVRQSTSAFNMAVFQNVKKLKGKGQGVGDKTAANLVIEAMAPVTQATYRRNALGWLTGRKPRPVMDPTTGDVVINGKRPGTPGATKVAPTDEQPPGSLTRTATSAPKPGVCKVKFFPETYEIYENEGAITLEIHRSGSLEKAVTVQFATADITATENKDYEQKQGTITFEPEVAQAQISIKIYDDDTFEKSETFRVELSDPSDGCELSSSGCTAIVTILNDDEYDASCGGFIGRLVNKDKCETIMDDWKKQFSDALRPGNEEEGKPGIVQWVVHLLTVVFKVAFAFVPPPQLLYGWAAFFVALGFIAIVTILIADLAELFGCTANIQPSITAITFVALGTSMPDTFASKTAATQEAHADASVGNITGSNCVNVFLGLGLPWTVAAVYWSLVDGLANPELYDEWFEKYKSNANVQSWINDNGGREGGKMIFVVEAGSLASSVVFFCICSLVCLLTLGVRRIMFGGELGGPAVPRYLTGVFFVGLWGVYLTVSILTDTNKIDAISLSG